MKGDICYACYIGHCECCYAKPHPVNGSLPLGWVLYGRCDCEHEESAWDDPAGLD